MEHLYYLVIDGQKCGPFRKDELLDAGMDGDTLVWYEGRDGWIRADQLVLFDELLKRERKTLKKQRKVQRQAAELPLPETLRGLSRLGIMLNIPAGVLYVLGTALLITAAILYLVGNSGPPPARPSRGMEIATWATSVVGVATAVLGGGLLAIELVVLASFTWKCRRIVRVLSPRGDQAQIEVRSFIQDLLDFGDITGDADLGAWVPFLIMFVILGGPLVATALCLLGGLFLAIAIAVLIVAAVFSICAVVFLVPYISLAFSIYRLGFGLNRIINDCKIEAPWAPVTLAFWVALCGLLLLFGPLSVPFFVLVPIWLHKTTATVVAICAQHIEAGEDPAAPTPAAPPPLPVKDASDQFMA